MNCRVLWVALALSAAACGPGDQQPADSASAPQPAPMYAAVSMKGDSVSLKSLEGKVVLLNIWATYCIPCREEMPYLQTLHTKFESKGFQVVGISVDARGMEDRINKFLGELSVTFPIWLDPDERASFVFRAIGVPASYLITRDGKIVWRKLGPIDANDPTLAAKMAELGLSQ